MSEELNETTVVADAAEATEAPESSVKALEEEGDIAADYLEELLDIFDLDGDIDIDVRQGRAYLEVTANGDSNLRLISDPETVEALQASTVSGSEIKRRLLSPFALTSR